ncbi:hypothetical protein DVB88_19680, partial [Tsukamurella pulmonis]
MTTPRTTDRPARRWRRLIPALLILGWLVLGAAGGPFAGKLGEVQSNDNTSFLPASAEATEVSRLEASFTDTSVIPAIVAVERTSGITDADTSFVTGAIDRAAGAGGGG